MLKSFCFGVTLSGLILSGSVLQAQYYDQVDAPRGYQQQSQYGQDTGYFQQRAQRGPQDWEAGQPYGQQYGQPYGPMQRPYGQRLSRRFEQQAYDQGQQAGLGVSLSSQAEEGVLVTRVHRDSPAEQAGLEPGDEILAINDRDVQSPEEVISQVQQQQPGETIRIQLQRDGQMQTVRARLETRREALARQGWGGQQRPMFDRRGQFQQAWSEVREFRGEQQMLTQIQQMQQTVNQLAQEIDSLRNQLEQQREAAYRGLDQQRQSLRERFQRGQQQREEQRRHEQQQREQQQREQQNY